MKRSYHIIDRKIPKYTSEERLRREEEKARKDEEEKEKARKDEKEKAMLKRKAGQNYGLDNTAMNEEGRPLSPEQEAAGQGHQERVAEGGPV